MFIERPKSKFPPTAEQEACLASFKQNRFTTIQARSGCGKTTTLRFLAESTSKRVLYLAFNKAMAEEARRKMPDNVESRTLHSICYQSMPNELRHKLTRPEGGYVNVASTGSEIAKKFKIGHLIDSRGKTLATKSMIGLMVKQTVGSYEFSDAEHIGREHFPTQYNEELKKKNVNIPKLVTDVIRYAKQLWRERIDPKELTLMTHDTYVKLYQLSGNDLGYDVIFGDEFQDVNAAFLSILKNAKSAKRIVVVGDEYQCVLGSTLTDTKEGKKPVAELVVGDYILSNKNRKQVFKKVTQTSISSRNTGVTITTSSGKKLSMTGNHKIWATNFPLKENEHLVYLMWRADKGFRVGVTNKYEAGSSSFGQRTRSERAQKLWIVSVASSWEDALFQEASFSLKYGIPQSVFEAEARGINQERIDKVFSEFGDNGLALLEDKDLSFDLPHYHFLTTSARGRELLKVSLRAQGLKGTDIGFEWTEKEWGIKEQLELLGAIVVRAKGDDRYRVRKLFSSYVDAVDFCGMLKDNIPEVSIDESLSFSDGSKYRLLTAAGIYPGAKIIVAGEDGQISAEEVTEVCEAEGVFYDIEVEDTANFFGNGILSHNCIYQFRGSSNMMIETAKLGAECELSASFRFGQRVGNLASDILSLEQKERVKLEGKGFDTQVGSMVTDFVDTSKPHTIIFRKNLTLLTYAMDKLADGVDLNMNVDTRDFVSMVDSVNALKRGAIDKVKHESILPYVSWDEFVEDAESNPDAKRLLGIIVSGKAGQIAHTLRTYKPVKNAKITLTTAHKAKGLEYDNVIIANDFPSNYDKEGNWVGLNESERNLLYVAHTRAIQSLQWNTTAQEMLDVTKAFATGRENQTIKLDNNHLLKPLDHKIAQSEAFDRDDAV